MGFAVWTGHHIDLRFVYSSDVSWGTKGDNKVSTDLGVVKVGKNTNEVEVAVPTAETDLNAAYEDAIHVLSTKPPKVESKPDAATEQEDYYRSFRTKWVPAISSFPFGTADTYSLLSACYWRGRCRTYVALHL
jgi:hypothetical protein